jgi:hypothetical protein
MAFYNATYNTNSRSGKSEMTRSLKSRSGKSEMTRSTSEPPIELIAVSKEKASFSVARPLVEDT